MGTPRVSDSDEIPYYVRTSLASHEVDDDQNGNGNPDKPSEKVLDPAPDASCIRFDPVHGDSFLGSL